MRAAMAMASPSNTNTSGNNINDNNNIISNTAKENQNPETTSNQAGAAAAAGGSPHDSSNAEAVANTARTPALQPELRDVNPEPHITEIFKIPSYSRWFSWDKIHSTERRFLPEFFDGKSAGKTPAVYKDYRDFIIGKYRENPQRKITCTEVRRMLVGDVNCVRRVFDFLENWGLINYQAVSAKQQHSKAAEININSNNNIINNRSNNGKNAGENVGQGKGILAGKALLAAASCDRDRGSGATDGKTTAGSTVMEGKPTGVSTAADGKGKEKRAVLCNVCRAECNKLRYACLKEIKPKLEEGAPSEEPGNSSGINDSSAEGLNRCKHDREKETPNEAMEEDPKDETNDEEAEQNGNKDKMVKKPDKLLRCPRCDSLGTKFCYYNNYNVNQPRYFCKNCQRYWTAGGTMRNVPVGAGRRKNKHSGSDYWSEMSSDDAAYYQAGYVLCPKCYSNGNYGLGLSATDFKRVEIKEESIQYRGVEWTDQETFRLLEAVMLFNDDWKHVAQHVGTKSEAECVTRFIQLPFGEQYMGSDGKEVSDRASNNANVESTAIKNICSPKDSSIQEHQDDASYDDKHFADDDVSGPLKQSHHTPFADASNPILAQVAFLSTMAGSRVAKAAAKAAVAVLCEDDLSVNQMQTTEESKSFNQKNGITASMTVGLEKDFRIEDDKKELHGGTDPMTQDGELFSGSKRSTPTVEEQEVAATVLESAAKRAKLLVDQQEQDIEHSFSTIIDTQMKKVLEKIQHFDEMEIIMEKEHSQLQQITHLLSLDRLHFIQQTMKSRSSGSQGKELDGS